MYKLSELTEDELLTGVVKVFGAGLQMKLIVPEQDFEKAKELIGANDEHGFWWSPMYDISLEVGNELVLTQR